MGNSLSERDENEGEFGEKIYEIVQQFYPESSENITGMLLELDYEELERLLTITNREELLARIHHAAGKNISSERVDYEQAKSNGIGHHSNGCQENPHPSRDGNLHLQELPANKNDKSNKLESSSLFPSGISTDHGNLEKRQALGEKIYSLIENQHPNDAEILTGILLEMDDQSLEHLIKDTDLLEKKVEEVLSVFQNNTEQMQNGESESVLKQAKDKTSIGEELYELVCTFDSDQADKITGMLLEMDLKDLEIIVKNQTALEEKVNEALTALNGQFSKAETTTSSVDEQEDKTLHGEQLYYLISEWFPDDTDKITGMLLELDVTTLNSLLKDPEALKEKATHAANALSETNINKEIPHSLASTSNSIQECRDNTLSDSEMKPVLAEQLYNIIEEWYPGKAEQLTGMLMDVDCATLETLVLNEQMLKEKLEGALDAVYKTAQTVPDRESTKHHSEEEFTKEELGGKLYEKIEESHPEDADKITGMLLEMTVEDIERLLKNPQELQDKIQLAEKALE